MSIVGQPGARRNEIKLSTDGRLRVAATQVAEKGKVNTAMVHLSSKALRIRKSRIEMLARETSVPRNC